MDRWKSLPVVCKGGLDLYNEVLTKGTTLMGVANQLQNYEPSVEGGYQRILGYTKWDSSVVPGDTNNPVLAVKPALGGVFAVRKTAGGDNALYFSNGGGWTGPLNSTSRTGSVTKARIISYSIVDEAVIVTDGLNPALKYDGSSDTLINGTGAPVAPSYAEEWKSRIALAPATSSASAFVISAPDTDDDFNGSNGAEEFNVSDVIVGLKRFRDILYIFCENSIYKLTGNTSADFAIEPVTKSIGCIGHDTIQEVGGDLIFLSTDGFRSIAATERIGDVELGLLSKLIQPLVRPVIEQAGSYNFSSTVVRSKSQYRLFYYNSDIAATDQRGFLGRYEVRDQNGPSYSWATLFGIPAYCCESAYVDNDELVVFGHPTTGYVYRMERTNSFDTGNISFSYRTPYFLFDELESRKVVFKIKIYGRTAGVYQMYLNTLLDFGSENIIQPPAVLLTGDGGVTVYGNAVYGTDVYTVTGEINIDQALVGSGIAIAFQFADTNDEAPHRIDSFVIEYSTKGRR